MLDVKDIRAVLETIQLLCLRHGLQKNSEELCRTCSLRGACGAYVNPVMWGAVGISEAACRIHANIGRVTGRRPVTHELKIWPGYFDMTQAGIKQYEVRKNDRGFMLGDVLRLREFSPVTQTYSGREVSVEVVSILLGGQLGIDPDYVLMGTRPCASGIRPIPKNEGGE